VDTMKFSYTLRPLLEAKIHCLSTNSINGVCGLYVDHIHRLLNKPITSNFPYNSDRKMYNIPLKSFDI